MDSFVSQNLLLPFELGRVRETILIPELIVIEIAMQEVLISCCTRSSRQLIRLQIAVVHGP